MYECSRLIVLCSWMVLSCTACVRSQIDLGDLNELQNIYLQADDIIYVPQA